MSGYIGFVLLNKGAIQSFALIINIFCLSFFLETFLAKSCENVFIKFKKRYFVGFSRLYSFLFLKKNIRIEILKKQVLQKFMYYIMIVLSRKGIFCSIDANVCTIGWKEIKLT